MKYTIGHRIGDKGGFGAVYKCTSEKGDDYAIKFLENMDASSTERFKKEIRLTKRLSHPNVVKIIAYNADGDRKYYIMPLYSSSLKVVIPTLYGQYDRQYKVISEILNGVIYLHAEGVLHRDLKPQNILYNSDSDIVINDFGLGRQIDSASDRLTSVGDAFGTARYTAPEQFIDASSANEKSDIFSIGRIIEDIVTNSLMHSIPTADLEYIVNRCTQANPLRRFETATELKAAIDSVYQSLLGIVENDTTDDLLAKLKLGRASDKEVNELAMKLLTHGNGDNLEEFFQIIPNQLYQTFERTNGKLAEDLIVQMRQYYTEQRWGFGYTDTIGRNCERLYKVSNNSIVKANLLYTVIEVGISHNRWYVMDIATSLLKEVKNDVSQYLELANLLPNGHVYLNSLQVKYDELPSSLQPYYEYKRDG